MRISDWSSDVCSSDLLRHHHLSVRGGAAGSGGVEDDPVDAIGFAVAKQEFAERLGAVVERAEKIMLRHAEDGIILVDQVRLVPEAAVRIASADDRGIMVGELVGEPADLVPVPDAVDGEAIALARQCCDAVDHALLDFGLHRSEEHTSELQSLMRISYAVFCLKKKTKKKKQQDTNTK